MCPQNTGISSDIETQDNRRPHLSPHGLSTGPPLLHSGNPSIRLLHPVVIRPPSMVVGIVKGRVPSDAFDTHDKAPVRSLAPLVSDNEDIALLATGQLAPTRSAR